jgi:hypothetical protein
MSNERLLQFIVKKYVLAQLRASEIIIFFAKPQIAIILWFWIFMRLVRDDLIVEDARS